MVSYTAAILLSSFVLCVLANGFESPTDATSTLVVDGTPGSGRQIPDTFLGAFFEVSYVLISSRFCYLCHDL